jgi:hypothetical protein
MNTDPPNKVEPPAPVPVPPDLLAWASQTFDVREYLENIRDIETTGAPLEDFIAEVEDRIRAS